MIEKAYLIEFNTLYLIFIVRIKLMILMYENIKYIITD